MRRSRLQYRKLWIGWRINWHQTTIESASLFEGIHYSRSLSRARLDELCMDYSAIQRLRGGVPARQRYRAENVHDLVLVGRSTRIPRVQS